VPIWMTLAFLSVVSGVAYGLNSYALSRLNLALGTDLGSLPSLKLGFVALTVCYFVIGRWLTPRRPLVRLLAWCSGLWIGLLIYLVLFGALSHLGLWVGLLGPRAEFTALGLPPSWWVTLAVGVTLYGVFRVTRGPVVRQVSVEVKGLPSALEGLRIAQLSDIHIGPTLGERFARRLTQMTRALNPDLVVITGDLVDGSVERLKEDVAPFFELSAPLGVYFVTGNHELISEADPWVAHLKANGLTVLENQGLTLTYKGASLNLAGVEDWEGSRFPPPRPPSLTSALRGLDLSVPTVLLAHQPKVAKEASEAGVDLQLSGHTHGGQLTPFSWLIYLDQPYRAGLYKVGEMSLYVSEGTGYWGPPVRVGTQSELTLVTLTAQVG